mgnify:CR=1 FL=1
MSDSFEDQLATAFVAKMAGMTLKQVDDYTVGIPKSGPATRIDPASFLTAVHQRKKQEQQREAEELNRLAEQMYPLPEPIPLPVDPPQTPLVPAENNNITPLVASPEIVDILKSINSSLQEFISVYKEIHKCPNN